VILGCASNSSDSPKAAAINLPAGGYAPDRHYQTISSRDLWTVAGDSVDVNLLVPAPPGVYPLVLYLPGLGQSPDAGLPWRQSWAQAGYAVLCVQPTKFGSAIWTSSRARAGDFSTIARDAFSAPSLSMRTQIVRDTLEQISRRQRDARVAAFTQIDLARIAVAGFDLGAQTALAVAGASMRGVEPLSFPDTVKAAIVLNPYADNSGTQSNLQPIRLPVLAITSALDTDAYGLLSSASIRRAQFEQLPPGRKYLLLLASAPHAVLGGATPFAAGDGKDTRDGPTAEDDKILGDETAEIEEGRHKRRRRIDYSLSRADKLAQSARVRAQVQAVTTAYLDAIVRSDAAAAAWLTKNATRWLGDSAELISK
jgi:dienelactone hydrolase